MTQTDQKISPRKSEDMLRFQKGILQKVSFNQDLFERELQKAERWLLVEDLKKLVDWVLDQFTHVFTDLEEKVKRMFSYLFSSPALG